MHVKKESGLRSNEAPHYRNNQRTPRVRRGDERQQSQSKDRGGAGQPEGRQRRVGVSRQCRPNWIEDQRVYDKTKADNGTPARDPPELERATHNAVPEEDPRTPNGQRTEHIGQWIDRPEKGEMIGDAKPRPEQSENGGNHDTGPRPRKEYEGNCCYRRSMQNNLCRPYGRVIGGDDIEELLDRKGQWHRFVFSLEGVLL